MLVTQTNPFSEGWRKVMSSRIYGFIVPYKSPSESCTLIIRISSGFKQNARNQELE